MLLNNIMEKKLLGMFKRGSVFPLRTQKRMWNQNLELPRKTAVQKSKYSTNSWTGPLLLLTSFPIKSPYLLFDHLLTVYTNWFQIITFKGSLVQFHRKTSDSWCLEQLMKRSALTLQRQEGACVSSILNTLSTATSSSISLRFMVSPFCCWD